MRKIRVCVRIDPDQLEELNIISSESGESLSDIVRDAIEDYLTEHKKSGVT